MENKKAQVTNLVRNPLVIIFLMVLLFLFLSNFPTGSVLKIISYQGSEIPLVEVSPDCRKVGATDWTTETNIWSRQVSSSRKIIDFSGYYGSFCDKKSIKDNDFVLLPDCKIETIIDHRGSINRKENIILQGKADFSDDGKYILCIYDIEDYKNTIKYHKEDISRDRFNGDVFVFWEFGEGKNYYRLDTTKLTCSEIFIAPARKTSFDYINLELCNKELSRYSKIPEKPEGEMTEETTPETPSQQVPEQKDNIIITIIKSIGNFFSSIWEAIFK
jgi:hypothetical protein